REDLALRRVEPLTQVREPRRMQLHCAPGRVGELDARLQSIPEAGVLDQPEVGRRRVPGGQVRGGVFAVGRENMDALGRDAAPAQEFQHLLEVLEVTQIVRGGLTAAVDQQGVNDTGLLFRTIQARLSGVVRTFRSARRGRPEGLHYRYSC